MKGIQVKTVAKVLVFMLIGIVIFSITQKILEPSSNGGFQTMDKNSIDVIFLGTSHQNMGVSPMWIYEKTGIRSYNLSTSAQPIECSYYMLEEAFLKQRPSYVFFDVMGLFHDMLNDVNADWWRVFNELPFDSAKMNMIKDYGTKWYSDGAFSAILPIIKYHTRWNQLTQSDFSFGHRPSYSAGQAVDSRIYPFEWDVESINAVYDEAEERGDGVVNYYIDDDHVSETISEPYFVTEIQKYYIDYLLSMKQLCESNGSKLILMKIPSCFFPQQDSGSWTLRKSDCVQELAEEYDLPYFDLMYGTYSCKIDWENDTIDRGKHLNFRGSIKCSEMLCDILQEMGCPTEKNSQYDAMLEKFNMIKNVAMLESERDFRRYIERLSEQLDHITVFLATCGDYTGGISKDDFVLLQECLGFEHASEGGLEDTYVAVLDNGKILFEISSDRKIQYEFMFHNRPALITSVGWYEGQMCYFKFLNSEYRELNRGLNILVYDNTSEMIIDRVCFDTHFDKKLATRDYQETRDRLWTYATQNR